MFPPRLSAAHSMGWGLTLHLPACFTAQHSCIADITETTHSAPCIILIHVRFQVNAVPQLRVLKPFNPCSSSPPQIVLHREKEVKQTECDMAMVHHLLSRIPQDLPYELLIGQAQDLFDQYPPSLLAKRAALQSRKR